MSASNKDIIVAIEHVILVPKSEASQLKPLEEWSDQDVALWVSTLDANYEQYADSIISNGIDGKNLISQTFETFFKIILDQEDCRKILAKRDALIPNVKKMHAENKNDTPKPVKTASQSAFHPVNSKPNSTPAQNSNRKPSETASSQFAAHFVKYQKNLDHLTSIEEQIKTYESFTQTKEFQQTIISLKQSKEQIQKEQKALLKSAFNFWSKGKFPNWATLGQRLFNELTKNKENPELAQEMLESANQLAHYHLDRAQALENSNEPHHLKMVKEFIVNAIDYLQEAGKACSRLKASKHNLETTAKCYKMLSNIKLTEEDNAIFLRVLGVEKEVPTLTKGVTGDEATKKKTVEQKIFKRIQEVIREWEKTFAEHFVSEKPKTHSNPAFDIKAFNELSNTDAECSQYAKKLSTRDPITGETLLHFLAKNIQTEAQRGKLKKILNHERKAILMEDNNGLLPADVAIDIPLQIMLGQHVPGEHSTISYWLDNEAGWGIIPLGKAYAIDAQRLAAQVSATLQATLVKNEGGCSVAGVSTPVIMRSMGCHFNYHSDEVDVGTSCLKHILIKDNAVNNNEAALFFVIDPAKRNNKNVKEAITTALTNLGLHLSATDSFFPLLMETVKAEDNDALQILLKNPEIAKFVNREDHEGYPPLWYAVNQANKQQNIGMSLIAAGADASIIKKWVPYLPEVSLIHFASENGHHLIVDKMLKQIKSKKSWTDPFINTVLRILLANSVYYGNVKLAEVLLQNGADPNSVNEDGDTVLLLAAGFMSGIGYTQPSYFTDLVKLFLKYNADVYKLTKTRMNHCLLPTNIGIQTNANAMWVCLQALSYSNNRMYVEKIKAIAMGVIERTSVEAKPDLKKASETLQAMAYNGKTAIQFVTELKDKELIEMLQNLTVDQKTSAEITISQKNFSEFMQAVLKSEASTCPKEMYTLEGYELTGKVYLNMSNFGTIIRFDNESDPFWEFMQQLEYTMSLIATNIKDKSQTKTSLTNNPELAWLIPYFDLIIQYNIFDVAKHYLNLFSTLTQLYGWVHVQNYINNPQQYIERTKCPPKGDDPAASNTRSAAFTAVDRHKVSGAELDKETVLTASNPIDVLQDNDYIRELFYLLSYQIHEIVKINMNGVTLREKCLFSLFLSQPAFRLAKEKQLNLTLGDRASHYMGVAEAAVTNILTKNPQKFHAYKELQRKGVQWPHSSALRNEVERAGYVFRPMMIKRDRCICETCGVELAGFKSWQDPWSFHNYAKHPPAFRPAHLAK